MCVWERMRANLQNVTESPGPGTPKGMRFAEVVLASVLLAAAVLGWCCCHIIFILNTRWQFPIQSQNPPLFPPSSNSHYLPAGMERDGEREISNAAYQIPEKETQWESWQKVGNHSYSYCFSAHPWKCLGNDEPKGHRLCVRVRVCVCLYAIY